MKRFFYFLVGISVILLFQHNALGANAYKIAVVDVQKLQKNSVAFQKTRANLKKKFEALQHLIIEELGSDYEMVEAHGDQLPLTVDTKKKRVVINPQSALLPKPRSKRELASLIAIAFEIAMLAPQKERRRRFYKLLRQLLNL